MNKIRQMIILGSGPAGLTAAIYAGRANLQPLVFGGMQPGGQLMDTTDVENYPGFPEGILGPELMAKMRAQAERFGAEIIDRPVDAVDFSSQPLSVTSQGETYQARTVILSTGASALWLGLESERRLRGKGVSSCATCDGFFFRGKDIAVIGGGDTAMEEATFLTKFANKVTVVHRRDQLRASKAMQDRALKNPKIEFLYSHEVSEVLGQDAVEGLKLRHVETGEEMTLSVQGVFVAIGHKPNTDLFAETPMLVRDAKGYLVPESETETKIPGVFVAGDVFDHRYRQAVTAAGSGCKAAMDAEKWLEEQGDTE